MCEWRDEEVDDRTVGAVSGKWLVQSDIRRTAQHSRVRTLHRGVRALELVLVYNDPS
jgi:hypothetical protein